LATPASALTENSDDGRDGKKAVIAYFRPDVNNTLRHIAIDESTTMQALIGEAINLLVTKRGLPSFDFEE
jgi:hypothetical protein